MGPNFGAIAAKFQVSAGVAVRSCLLPTISLLAPTSAGGSGRQRACRRERRSRKPGGGKGPWSGEACPSQGMRGSRWQRRQLRPPSASMARMRTILLAVVLLGPPVQQCSARLGALPPTWHFSDGLHHPDALGMRDGGVGARCSSACSSAPSRAEGGIDRGPAMPLWGGREEGPSGQGVTSRQGLRGGGLSQLISSLKNNGVGKAGAAAGAAGMPAEVVASVPVEIKIPPLLETGQSERRRGRPRVPLHGNRMPKEDGPGAERLEGAVGRVRRPFTVEGQGLVGRPRLDPVGDGSPPLIPQVLLLLYSRYRS